MEKILNKIGGIAIIAAGIALSVFWIIKDPGFTAVFSRSVVFIGFVPIPGVLFGILIQIIPAIGGFVGGLSLFIKN